MKYIKLFEDFNFDYSSDTVKKLSTKYDYGWVRRVIRNILELSVEKYNLDTALTEWTYSGIREEDPTVSLTCDICGQHPLRYKFLIENDLNNNTYWIGSECILKFSYEYSTGLKIRDDNGNFITNPDMIMDLIRRHYNQLIKDSAVKYVLAKLEELYNKVKDGHINKLYLQYAELNYFKPSQIIWLDRLFRMNGMTDLHKSKFNVNISNWFYLDDVLDTDDITFRSLLPYLKGNLQKGDRSRAVLRRNEYLKGKAMNKDIENIDSQSQSAFNKFSIDKGDEELDS
jgi:hypothetical protein